MSVVDELGRVEALLQTGSTEEKAWLWRWTLDFQAAVGHEHEEAWEELHIALIAFELRGGAIPHDRGIRGFGTVDGAG